DESHIQHMIRFIQYKAAKRTQVYVLLLYQIQQSARCSNKNIDTLLQLGDLCMLRYASKYHQVTYPNMFAVGFDTLIDLYSEFSCRNQYQSSRIFFVALFFFSQL